MSTDQTRALLMKAAGDTLAEAGMAGLSARVVARRAGVNQGLIFYHFGSLGELVDQAIRQRTAEAVARHRKPLERVTTFAELLAVGEQLHRVEQQAGNVRLMAQLLAAGQADPELARTARTALGLWIDALTATSERVLEGSILRSAIDAGDLARAVSAAFLGIELCDGIDETGSAGTLRLLGRLGVLVELLDELSPVERVLLRRRLNRWRVHTTS